MKEEGQIKELGERLEEIRRVIKEKISSLPGNPRINRLSDSPNCFVMQSKDLENSWSPEYHDFKIQYERIIQEINKAGAFNVINRLREITQSGNVKGLRGHSLRLHPDVVEHLNKLLEGGV